MATVAKNILQVTRKCRLLFYASITSCMSIAGANAQVVSDTTLPSNSIVTTTHDDITITGGTPAGANLFHSFIKFSVHKGERVYFDNAPTVKNIIMRVTGSDISNIDGLIHAAGNVNLYLLNPNGIHLGKNAELDINGSLFLSTADSWKFPDGIFSAVGTPPLLSISAPSGIQWGTHKGNIRLDGNLSSRNLNLAANNITIRGNLTNQINQTCSNQTVANRFTIIGRGGLPLNTTEALNLNSAWIDWRHFQTGDSEKQITQHQLVEANGWQLDNGKVRLVAMDVPPLTPPCNGK